MRVLPEVPAANHGAFDLGAARASGWTASALLNGVRSGRLVKVSRGWYVPTAQWQGDSPADDRRRLAIRAIAAGSTVRPAVASHAAAAVLAGLPLWSNHDRPCITVPPMFTGDARCAHLHRARLRPDDVVAGAMPRTASARTIVDIAREHGLEDAVVAGDAALHEGMTNESRLRDVLRCCEGWPGIRRARHVVDMLDRRSESPLESVSRLRFIAWNVPPPEPQATITDLDGHFLGRLDFYWPKFGVGGEVDGKMKYRTAADEAFFREKRRQEGLEDTGLIVVRWGLADLAAATDLPTRLRRAFARGQRLPAANRCWRAVLTPALPR